MAVACPRAALTGGTGSQLHVAGPPIQCRAGEMSTWLTRPGAVSPATKTLDRTTDHLEIVLKVLVIAALLALLFLLLYSRIYPYIRLLNKILGAARSMADSHSTGSASGRTSAARVESKLVRCVGCGTWIPSDRAIGSHAGGSIYCSRECIDKASSGQNRKVAG
jgi:hypothetical protein